MKHDEPLGEVTAIQLSWPAPDSDTCGMAVRALDQHFVYPDELLQGEPLHERIDLLLAEHSPGCYAGQELATEITVYWHVAQQWYKREYLSVMHCR